MLGGMEVVSCLPNALTQRLSTIHQAYLLTTATFRLVRGKLYTFFSIKWVFLWTVPIFELGSLICSVAPNSTALTVGRAIAGLGSAYLIIATFVPLAKCPKFTGLIGGTYGVAFVLGPLMGRCDVFHRTSCQDRHRQRHAVFWHRSLISRL